jgi:HD superfamily phosphodiesterase
MLNIFQEKIGLLKLTGNLREDVYRFLASNNCPRTAEHCMKVGEEAGRIARIFHADPDQAEAAGYLHDISAVYPSNERIGVAVQLGIEVLPEEEAFPMIVHQKISRVMAEHIFQIKEQSILDAATQRLELSPHFLTGYYSLRIKLNGTSRESRRINRS